MQLKQLSEAGPPVQTDRLVIKSANAEVIKEECKRVHIPSAVEEEKPRMAYVIFTSLVHVFVCTPCDLSTMKVDLSELPDACEGILGEL
eukprot:6140976-Amphidinium_carterae.2